MEMSLVLPKLEAVSNPSEDFEKLLGKVLDAEVKEEAIEASLVEYTFFLMNLTPSSVLLSKLLRSPELLAATYDEIRKMLDSEVKDSRTLRRAIEALAIAEEHDRFVLRLIPHRILDFLDFLGKKEAGIYLFEFLLCSLTLASVAYALKKRPRELPELIRLMSKFSGELEPFVATLQVHLEPEYAGLRKPTPRHMIEKAPRIKGSIFGDEA